MDSVTMWWLLVVLVLCYLLVVASQALVAVWTFLVHDLSCFTAMSSTLGLVTLCSVSFFSGAGAST